MLEALSAILSIVIIDLVLSGDNAVVIGMAARSLSAENRRKAIIFGGAGAIGLRIVFTALATVLLGIPGLQAFGGLLLFYIAVKLIRPHSACTVIGPGASCSLISPPGATVMSVRRSGPFLTNVRAACPCSRTA